jgi:hypothetical protein
MPREPSRNLRQEAEHRVEQRFAKQSEALFASHKEQRERDSARNSRRLSAWHRNRRGLPITSGKLSNSTSANGTRCATTHHL